MLRNRYLIAGLGLLLLVVLGWNIHFFIERRAAAGRQSLITASSASSEPASGRQKTETAVKKVFPVPQDPAVWRRDPFTLGSQASPIVKVRAMPDAPAREDALELQAVMTSGGKSFALVNGTVVGEGDRISNYRVAAISPYRIVLKSERGTREVSIIHETVKEK